MAATILQGRVLLAKGRPDVFGSLGWKAGQDDAEGFLEVFFRLGPIYLHEPCLALLVYEGILTGHFVFWQAKILVAAMSYILWQNVLQT